MALHDDVPPLTEAQHRVLAALRDAWSGPGPAPSLAGLCARLGLRSRGALHRHIAHLVRLGWVEPPDLHRLGLRPGPRARAHSRLAVAPQPAPEGYGRPPAWPASLPVRALRKLGRIAAGAPLDAVFEDEPLYVPEALVPRGEAYVLEVRGDSMNGDGILDGDLVVVEAGAVVGPHEIAVVLVAGEGATLKRLRRSGDQVHLLASNPAVPERIVAAADVAIQGRVAGLMRSFRW